MIHRRTSTTITLGFDEIRGFDYDYAYDPIGNRTSATYYDEQGEAVASAYSANALNQYTQRTVPGNVQIRGEADTDAIVTVNENPTWRYPSLGGSAAQTSPRSGATSAQPQLRRKAAETSVEVGGGSASYFYGGDYADNTTVPVFKEVEIAAVIPAAMPDGWDEMSAVTGRVFVAQTPETFEYDADGNMTCDGRFRYTWNAENRLVRAQELCAPTNRNPYTVTYAYDHRGRMVSKRITENDGQDTLVKSIAYLWDGWNIIREIQWPVASGQWPVVTDNVWGLDLDGTLQGAGGVGGLLAVQRSDCAATNSAFCILHSALYLPTYDANGNISEYVSTNGEIIAHYDYSPFGETLIESGDLASPFTHRFSTKPWCPVTGLYEYQMRKYRPEIGRWLSRDPIGEKGGVNQYLITRNSTILRVDILGKSSSWVHTRNVTLETIDCAEITIRANLALEVGEDIRLDGTIVQNMHLTKELYDCATRRLVEAADTKYAEAFSVGEVDFWGVSYLGQSACGTYGKVVWKGIATYYSTMPYANLTIVGPNSDSNSKWNGEWTMDPASDHPAGNLPHIDGYFNSGLHNNVSGLMRLLTYKWDCCGGKHSKSYSYLEISTRQTRPD